MNPTTSKQGLMDFSYIDVYMHLTNKRIGVFVQLFLLNLSDSHMRWILGCMCMDMVCAHECHGTVLLIFFFHVSIVGLFGSWPLAAMQVVVPSQKCGGEKGCDNCS